MSTPVSDWGNDYDILDHDYVADPFPIWDDLRRECPVAHSDRWGGSWMPTRYADVSAVAHDTTHFSSRDVGVLGSDPDAPEVPIAAGGIPVLPPISVDAPMHTWTRRLMLPWFSHHRVEGYGVVGLRGHERGDQGLDGEQALEQGQGGEGSSPDVVDRPETRGHATSWSARETGRQIPRCVERESSIRAPGPRPEPVPRW